MQVKKNKRFPISGLGNYREQKGKKEMRFKCSVLGLLIFPSDFCPEGDLCWISKQISKKDGSCPFFSIWDWTRRWLWGGPHTNIKPLSPTKKTTHVAKQRVIWFKTSPSPSRPMGCGYRSWESATLTWSLLCWARWHHRRRWNWADWSEGWVGGMVENTRELEKDRDPSNPLKWRYLVYPGAILESKIRRDRT